MIDHLPRYLGQVTREINIYTMQTGQVVGNQLKWDNRQDTSKTIRTGRYTNRFVLCWNLFITFCADNDGLTFTCRHLLQSAMNFLHNTYQT
jgi:hypothetical protein